MRSAASRLSKLAALSPSQRRDVVRAQLALLHAQLTVWTRPHGRLVRQDSGSRAPAADRDHITARRLAGAIALASRRGVFRPSCLVRSVALSRMLEREQVTGWHLRIGVRGDRGRRFEAHAWVELGTEVLADSSDHVASFQPLADVRLLGGR